MTLSFPPRRGRSAFEPLQRTTIATIGTATQLVAAIKADRAVMLHGFYLSCTGGNCTFNLELLPGSAVIMAVASDQGGAAGSVASYWAPGCAETQDEQGLQITGTNGLDGTIVWQYI